MTQSATVYPAPPPPLTQGNGDVTATVATGANGWGVVSIDTPSISPTAITGALFRMLEADATEREPVDFQSVHVGRIPGGHGWRVWFGHPTDEADVTVELEVRILAASVQLRVTGIRNPGSSFDIIDSLPSALDAIPAIRVGAPSVQAYSWQLSTTEDIAGADLTLSLTRSGVETTIAPTAVVANETTGLISLEVTAEQMDAAQGYAWCGTLRATVGDADPIDLVTLILDAAS